MTLDYLNTIKQAFVLYCNFGLKYQKKTEPIPQLVSKEPYDLDLKDKIIYELESTYIGDFPIGLLYMFKNLRLFRRKLELLSYYYNEEKKICIPVCNGEDYLLACMSESPEDYALYDQAYNFWLKGNINVIRGIYHYECLTKTQLFKQTFNYIKNQQITEFFIYDYKLISEFGSYWNDFKRKNLEYATNMDLIIDFKCSCVALSQAFSIYCKALNKDFNTGYKYLKRELKPYNKYVRIPIIDPITKKKVRDSRGRILCPPVRGYYGVRIKDPQPDPFIF